MTFIVRISEEVACIIDYTYRNKAFYKIETLIPCNFSLIRELVKEFLTKSITKNSSGYVTIKRDNGKKTTIQRRIIEFYAKFDLNLKEECKKLTSHDQ